VGVAAARVTMWWHTAAMAISQAARRAGGAHGGSNLVSPVPLALARAVIAPLAPTRLQSRRFGRLARPGARLGRGQRGARVWGEMESCTPLSGAWRKEEAEI
jgi:hypothetical protein